MFKAYAFSFLIIFTSLQLNASSAPTRGSEDGSQELAQERLLSVAARALHDLKNSAELTKSVIEHEAAKGKGTGKICWFLAKFQGELDVTKTLLKTDDVFSEILEIDIDYIYGFWGWYHRADVRDFCVQGMPGEEANLKPIKKSLARMIVALEELYNKLGEKAENLKEFRKAIQ